MRLLEFFRLNQQPPSADTAKQRLQVIIAHERVTGPAYEFLPLLQRELLEVIRKYVEVDPNRVKVDIEKGEGMSVLEVNIELPLDPARASSWCSYSALSGSVASVRSKWRQPLFARGTLELRRRYCVRRQAELALERAVERRLPLVAHLQRDGQYRFPRRFEQPRGKLQSPSCQVGQRRLAVGACRSVRVVDGQALELADNSFDLAGSHFGVMLSPDMPKGGARRQLPPRRSASRLAALARSSARSPHKARPGGGSAGYAATA